MENWHFADNQREAMFNAGIAKLQRIDTLKKIAIEARLSRELQTWYEVLKCIRAEIWERLNQSEKDEMLNDNEMDALLFSWQSEIKKISNPLVKNKNISNILYRKLDERDRRIGELEFKYGLSLPNKPSGAQAGFF